MSKARIRALQGSSFFSRASSASPRSRSPSSSISATASTASAAAASKSSTASCDGRCRCARNLPAAIEKILVADHGRPDGVASGARCRLQRGERPSRREKACSARPRRLAITNGLSGTASAAKAARKALHAEILARTATRGAPARADRMKTVGASLSAKPSSGSAERMREASRDAPRREALPGSPAYPHREKDVEHEQDAIEVPPFDVRPDRAGSPFPASTAALKKRERAPLPRGLAHAAGVDQDRHPPPA